MRLFITILFFLITGTCWAGRGYYFANTGNDFTGAGTLASPYQNLTKIVALPLTGTDTIRLRSGDVFLGSITINTDGVTINSYGAGAKAKITGFVTLSSWTNAGGNIWEAGINVGTRLNVLSINSQPQARGRYPNTGFLSFESHSLYNSITDDQYNGITNWAANGTAEIFIRPQPYLGNVFPITGQAGTGGKIFSYSGGNNADYDNREPHNGYGFIVQNDRRTLDDQGEYFYSASAQIVSMFSLVNPASFAVRAASIDTLIKINNANNVRIDNVDIVGCNKVAVYITGGTGISITNCDIHYVGINAIDARFSNNLNVSYNTIKHVYNNGIDAALGNSNMIEHNTIDSIGLIYGEGKNGNLAHSGIFLNSPGGFVQFNSVTHTGYYGIVFTGSNLKVRNNYVDSCVFKYGDGGGIYTSGPGAGREITGNRVLNTLGSIEGTSDIYPLGEGIYPDEASEKILIAYNIIFNSSHYGVYLHDGHSITVDNNKITKSGVAGIAMVHDFLQQNVPMRGMVITNNIITSYSQQPTVAINSFASTSASILLQSTTPSYQELQAFGICENNTYICPFKRPDFIRISYRPVPAGVSVSTSQEDSNAFRMDYAYNLARWQSDFGQDKHSITGPTYPAYTYTTTGPELYPGGNFSSGINGKILNPYPGYSSITAPTGQLMGMAAALTYTGTDSSNNGIEMWGYDDQHTETLLAGHTYMLKFDIKATGDNELMFRANLRSSANSNSSEMIAFMVNGYRSKQQFVFTLATNLEGHYFSIFAPSAKNVFAYYIDNVSLQEVDTTQTNPEDFIRFVHNSTGTTQTITNAAGFTDERGRPANGPMLPGDVKVLFAGPSIMYKGRLNPVTQ